MGCSFLGLGDAPASSPPPAAQLSLNSSNGSLSLPLQAHGWQGLSCSCWPRDALLSHPGFADPAYTFVNSPFITLP